VGFVVENGTLKGFSPSSSSLPCQYHSTMLFHANVSPGDQQKARWRLHFRDIVSSHRHEEQCMVFLGYKDKNFSFHISVGHPGFLRPSVYVTAILIK
jgi:hypothetical protein